MFVFWHVVYVFRVCQVFCLCLCVSCLIVVSLFIWCFFSFVVHIVVLVRFFVFVCWLCVLCFRFIHRFFSCFECFGLFCSRTYSAPSAPSTCSMPSPPWLAFVIELVSILIRNPILLLPLRPLLPHVAMFILLLLLRPMWLPNMCVSFHFVSRFDFFFIYPIGPCSTSCASSSSSIASIHAHTAPTTH